MSLLAETLPDISLRPDVEATAFFDRCEAIAKAKGYRIDRRRNYAGRGFDLLNLHLAPSDDSEVMLRMVSTPNSKGRLKLDVVARWSSHSIPYDEYLKVAKAGYTQLLRDYAKTHNKRLRLGIPRRGAVFDPTVLDCGSIGYAWEKFSQAMRDMAIGEGDIRDRLRTAYMTVHVVRSEDLPAPLDAHLRWIREELTKRQARHSHEGTLDATLAQMKRITGGRIAKRMQEISDALEELDQLCAQRSIRGTRRPNEG